MALRPPGGMGTGCLHHSHLDYAPDVASGDKIRLLRRWPPSPNDRSGGGQEGLRLGDHDAV